MNIRDEQMAPIRYDYHGAKLEPWLNGTVKVFWPDCFLNPVYVTTSLDLAMRWVDAYRAGQQRAVEEAEHHTDAALLIDESHERERRDQASLDWMRHETELIRLEGRQAEIIATLKTMRRDKESESVATRARQELKRVEAEIAERRSILQYKNEGHPGT